MINDQLAGYSEEQLKTALMAERILREECNLSWNTAFVFGEPDVTDEVKEVTSTWGSYSWTRHIKTMTYHLPEDWYDRIYLAGIGKVTYHNKTSLVLDAKPSSKVLRSDLQLDGFQVHEVKLPVFASVATGKMNGTGRWARPVMREEVQLVDRYMVSCVLPDGNSSYAFAAQHVNAAAANLKRKMMKQMTQMMGV